MIVYIALTIVYLQTKLRPFDFPDKILKEKEHALENSVSFKLTKENFLECVRVIVYFYFVRVCHCYCAGVLCVH